MNLTPSISAAKRDYAIQNKSPPFFSHKSCANEYFVIFLNFMKIQNSKRHNFFRVSHICVNLLILSYPVLLKVKNKDNVPGHVRNLLRTKPLPSLFCGSATY